MKVLCVYLAALLALAVAHHGHDLGDHETESKDCPNLTEEVLEKLKKHLVTEDIHDQFVGERSEVWGAKQFLEKDSEACVRTIVSKFDDKILNQTAYFRNKEFAEGEKRKNGTLEKVENGIYIAKKGCGKAWGKVFVIYAKDDVFAYYICKFNQKPSDEADDKKKWKVPYFTAVMVNAKEAKAALDEPVQKNVDEALKKIQSDPELFGEMQQHTNFC